MYEILFDQKYIPLLPSKLHIKTKSQVYISTSELPLEGGITTLEMPRSTLNTLADRWISIALKGAIWEIN